MADLFIVSEAQEEGENHLERALGPVSLTALGVGAVIGAGIFVMAGLGAHYAGPGLMLSFVLSGLGCAFAGLCYAEFAAMIPLAGSAYTYSYATLGEIFAWIIGWDLTLEYAMGASTVSSGLPTSSNFSRCSTSNCRSGSVTTIGLDSKWPRKRQPASCWRTRILNWFLARRAF
jgi:amino acid transporter